MKRGSVAFSFNGFAFEAISFHQDDLPMPEGYVSRGEVADALMVAEILVVGDEVADLLLEISG